MARARRRAPDRPRGLGNLTEGGVVANDEQFELLRHDSGTASAAAHERRYLALVRHAVSLDEAEGSAAWREWQGQLQRRRQLGGELRALDARLASRQLISRQAHKQTLLDDLDDLYERTRAARLPQRDGKPYVPNRFKQGIDRARRTGDPVPLVARICRYQTTGFDVIRVARRRDLTVEALVVDASKPYHDLFTAETKRLSSERLRQFDTSADPAS